jgi:hypothetical protein
VQHHTCTGDWRASKPEAALGNKHTQGPLHKAMMPLGMPGSLLDHLSQAGGKVRKKVKVATLARLQLGQKWGLGVVKSPRLPSKGGSNLNYGEGNGIAVAVQCVDVIGPPGGLEEGEWREEHLCLARESREPLQLRPK